MNAIFGHYPQPREVLESATRLRFPDAGLALTWKHCSSSADFLSRFYAGVLAASSADARELARNISYLANELMENVVKFRAAGEVAIEAGLGGGDFVLRIRNPISAATGRDFRDLLETLTTRDPGELLIERIEANAADEDNAGSGLGLLTLINDYGARLGWQFEQPAGQPGADLLLHTEARLSLSGNS